MISRIDRHIKLQPPLIPFEEINVYSDDAIAYCGWMRVLRGGDIGFSVVLSPFSPSEP
jgi:hypothetical protein